MTRPSFALLATHNQPQIASHSMVSPSENLAIPELVLVLDTAISCH
jgi:hypothetical protein